MMIFTLLTIQCLHLAAGQSFLKSALRNPAQFLKLYNEFRVTQHKSYPAAEARLRVRNFRKSVELVVQQNSKEGSWNAELNFFSDMSPEEKAMYTGANITATERTWNDVTYKQAFQSNPESKDWSGDAVTKVKNQGRCGSGWAFAAVGALEGQYKVKAGALKTFSEQEAVDCTYEDGCGGGKPEEFLDWVKKSGRIAAASDLPYTAVSGSCSHDSKPNALESFKVTGYGKATDDTSHETALATQGPISVTFTVPDSFFGYRRGIFTASSCSGPGHAVVSVGYGKDFFRLKNSWGSYWGESGFFRIGRGNVCGISSNGLIPTVEAAKEE